MGDRMCRVSSLLARPGGQRTTPAPMPRTAALLSGRPARTAPAAAAVATPPSVSAVTAVPARLPDRPDQQPPDTAQAAGEGAAAAPQPATVATGPAGISSSKNSRSSDESVFAVRQGGAACGHHKDQRGGDACL